MGNAHLSIHSLDQFPRSHIQPRLRFPQYRGNTWCRCSPLVNINCDESITKVDYFSSMRCDQDSRFFSYFPNLSVFKQQMNPRSCLECIENYKECIPSNIQNIPLSGSHQQLHSHRCCDEPKPQLITCEHIDSLYKLNTFQSQSLLIPRYSNSVLTNSNINNYLPECIEAYGNQIMPGFEDNCDSTKQSAKTVITTGGRRDEVSGMDSCFEVKAVGKPESYNEALKNHHITEPNSIKPFGKTTIATGFPVKQKSHEVFPTNRGFGISEIKSTSLLPGNNTANTRTEYSSGIGIKDAPQQEEIKTHKYKNQPLHLDSDVANNSRNNRTSYGKTIPQVLTVSTIGSQYPNGPSLDAVSHHNMYLNVENDGRTSQYDGRVLIKVEKSISDSNPTNNHKVKVYEQPKFFSTIQTTISDSRSSTNVVSNVETKSSTGFPFQSQRTEYVIKSTSEPNFTGITKNSDLFLKINKPSSRVVSSMAVPSEDIEQNPTEVSSEKQIQPIAVVTSEVELPLNIGVRNQESQTENCPDAKVNLVNLHDKAIQLDLTEWTLSQTQLDETNSQVIFSGSFVQESTHPKCKTIEKNSKKSDCNVVTIVISEDTATQTYEVLIPPTFYIDSQPNQISPHDFNDQSILSESLSWKRTNPSSVENRENCHIISIVISKDTETQTVEGLMTPVIANDLLLQASSQPGFITQAISSDSIIRQFIYPDHESIEETEGSARTTSVLKDAQAQVYEVSETPILPNDSQLKTTNQVAFSDQEMLSNSRIKELMYPHSETTEGGEKPAIITTIILNDTQAHTNEVSVTSTIPNDSVLKRTSQVNFHSQAIVPNSNTKQFMYPDREYIKDTEESARIATSALKVIRAQAYKVLSTPIFSDDSLLESASQEGLNNQDILSNLPSRTIISSDHETIKETEESARIPTGVLNLTQAKTYKVLATPIFSDDSLLDTTNQADFANQAILSDLPTLRLMYTDRDTPEEIEESSNLTVISLEDKQNHKYEVLETPIFSNDSLSPEADPESSVAYKLPSNLNLEISEMSQYNSMTSRKPSELGLEYTPNLILSDIQLSTPEFSDIRFPIPEVKSMTFKAIVEKEQTPIIQLGSQHTESSTIQIFPDTATSNNNNSNLWHKGTREGLVDSTMILSSSVNTHLVNSTSTLNILSLLHPETVTSDNNSLLKPPARTVVNLERTQQPSTDSDTGHDKNIMAINTSNSEVLTNLSEPSEAYTHTSIVNSPRNASNNAIVNTAELQQGEVHSTNINVRTARNSTNSRSNPLRHGTFMDIIPPAEDSTYEPFPRFSSDDRSNSQETSLARPEIAVSNKLDSNAEMCCTTKNQPKCCRRETEKCRFPAECRRSENEKYRSQPQSEYKEKQQTRFDQNQLYPIKCDDPDRRFKGCQKTFQLTSEPFSNRTNKTDCIEITPCQKIQDGEIQQNLIDESTSIPHWGCCINESTILCAQRLFEQKQRCHSLHTKQTTLNNECYSTSPVLGNLKGDMNASQKCELQKSEIVNQFSEHSPSTSNTSIETAAETTTEKGFFTGLFGSIFPDS